MKCDTLCITFKRRPNSIKFYLQVDHGTMFRKAPNEYYRTAVKEYTVELGLTYYTTEGPVLHCHTDVSYNSQTNGDAQAGVLLSIGQHSAPIHVQAGHLKRKIPLGPCQAEYMGMTNGVKAVMWIRNVLSAIGYEQTQPTPLYQDNMSAKNLAESPTIQRRSRHIDMFEHANRQAVQDGIVRIIHQRTADQRADILTKPIDRKSVV